LSFIIFIIHFNLGFTSEITQITVIPMSVSTSTNHSHTISTETSTPDETVTSELEVAVVVAIQSPDESDAIAISAGALADAVGDDTLTIVDVSGDASDDGVLASVDLDFNALAIAESPDDGAYASAGTDVSISPGAEILVVITNNETTTVTTDAGSVSIATSETSVDLIDIDLSDVGGDVDTTAVDESPASESAPNGGDQGGDDSQPGDAATDYDLLDLIDGNIAIVELDVTVAAPDTELIVDAFAFVIEDELSTSATFIDMAFTV
jgi:hypothetical protein